MPELAARAHSEKIDLIIKKAIKKSKVKMDQIDGVACTAGPGLFGLSAGGDDCR